MTASLYLVINIERSSFLEQFSTINSAESDVVDAFDVEDAWDAFNGA